MDDEDSQDELINRNISNGKGKRPAMSVFSEEEDNPEDGEDSQEGETDSDDDEDDDGEGSQDGEDEEVVDEEDDSEDEEAEKDVEGVVGSTSTDLAGLSSDEDADKCPICLNSFHEQPVATPESCEHYFCLDCILEWAKNANSCPVDRIIFSNILLRKCFGGKVQKTIAVQKPVKPDQVDQDLEHTSCEVCGGSDREDRLLLCDGCDAGYHMECLTPPLDAVPVEEWFCPQCAANNNNNARNEDESSVRPTTSRSWPGFSRPTRAIARTQHSERVRANVNRHRITQARTAAQFAPRSQIQSTWLDETISAVVAGLNTAVYIRDLTPRPRARRKRRTVKRRKNKKEGKAAGGKATGSTKVKRRRRRVRRTKSRRKVVVKKEPSAKGRIARSLGIRKPVNSSTIPSVYRPSEHTLSSMRADIGAASLSIYGDPFDLDPFDDENDELEQGAGPSSLLEAKRRGLSHSAMRSHQPVARPVSAGLSSRRGHGMSQVEEEAPVPDLLGSILSGQSMLLMDSSDVIINRDGSLKAAKPVCLSSPRSSISGDCALGGPGSTAQTSRDPAPSSSPSSSLSSPSPCPCPLPQTPTSPSPYTPPSGPPHLYTSPPRRPSPSNADETRHNQRGSCGARGQPPTRVTSDSYDSRLGERGQAPSKKPPPKPVWVDVSMLPKIPKIKRESSSARRGSNSSNTISFPEAFMTRLAGDKGRQQSVDQGQSVSQQGRTVDGQRQRLDRAGSSSSFSNSFSAPSSSASMTSGQRPSSSSISFRINTSGNTWHHRRLSTSESTLPTKGEDPAKRNQKDKEMLLSSNAKKASVKAEVYDPFNPTGSDSSEDEAENDHVETSQGTVPFLPPVGHNKGAEQVKTEPMDMDPPVKEENSGMWEQVKKESDSAMDDPWSPSSRQTPTGYFQTQPESRAAVRAYSGSPATSDTNGDRSVDSPFTKTSDRSRSSSYSSHQSDHKVKVEVKTEPDESCPIKAEPLDEGEYSQGNGLCAELPAVASRSDVSHKSKQRDERFPHSRTKEESSEPASRSHPPRDSERPRESKKRSRPENSRRSSSRSPVRKRSRSRSNERRRSRSRSTERKRSRGRRRSTRSSSRESLRKRKEKREGHEQHDSRGKDGWRRSKEKRRSRSRSRSRSRTRSRSRSRERMREQPSRDGGETRSKRKRSRSTSRERRQRGDVSKHARPEERSAHRSVPSTSFEAKEPTHSLNKNERSIKKERVSTGGECETTVPVLSVKKEIQPSSDVCSTLIEVPKRPVKVTEPNALISASGKLHEAKPKELKPEQVGATRNVKEFQLLKDVKNEREQYFKSCESVKTSKEMKTEEIPKLEPYEVTPPSIQGSVSAPQVEMKNTTHLVDPPRQIKIEKIWPDEEEEEEEEEEEDYYDPFCSDGALVISLTPPGADATDCGKGTDGDSVSLPVYPVKEEMKSEPLQTPCSVKQEPMDSSDEDINVDYLIDNLDFIKKEMKEGSVTDAAGAAQPLPVTREESAQVVESASVTAGTKAKSQGKRVTWNIQEPEGPQPEKMSKLALFKLKLKQEGSRKAAAASSSSFTPHSCSQEAVPVQAEPKPSDSNLSSPTQEGQFVSGQRRSKSHREELLQDPQQKDKYMKKLHMQERAIEEVKLAIKPFYQKRDITKEEYKEILRKAVQKVCHSKSGEINPVKVANLVKAYVDKYKHARRHRKGEECRLNQNAEDPKE